MYLANPHEVLNVEGLLDDVRLLADECFHLVHPVQACSTNLHACTMLPCCALTDKVEQLAWQNLSRVVMLQCYTQPRSCMRMGMCTSGRTASALQSGRPG